MIQAIAFDFGGTLFSTARMGIFTPPMMDAFLDATSTALHCTEYEAKEIFQAFVQGWRSRRARGCELPDRETSSLDLLRVALGARAPFIDACQCVAILDSFHGEESREFTPLPGVLECLPALIARGFRLAMVCNNPWPEAVLASLRRHGLLSCFEKILVSSQVGYRKPHPTIFQTLLKEMALSASDILFVGDSFAHDIEVPSKLDFKTCLVDFEGTNKNKQRADAHRADFFLARMNDLIPALAAIGRR